MLTGTRTTTISGSTTLDTIQVLMMITGGQETRAQMILTGAVSAVSTLHVVFKAPTANTADEAASALSHSR